MSEPYKELTREELHALVWRIPMSRLADQFGISGNGLAKICRRLDVPYPPRGWWAKKAAGKTLSISPLGTAPPSVSPLVRICPTSSNDGGLKADIEQKREELDKLS